MSDFTFTSLDKEAILHHFDCDDADINEFLHEDALKYQLQKIANTYLFLDDNSEIVAFNKERQVKYYQRNGFNLLLENDVTDHTRIMYFDLLRLQ